MNHRHLKGLMAQSPVPIYEVTDTLDSRFLPFYDGYYHIEDSYIVIIEIDPRPVYEKFFIISHEIQHAKCAAKGCQCLCGDQENTVLCEFHAFKNSLKQYMELSVCPVYFIEFFMDSDTRFAYHPDYIIAANKLKQTELWAEALRINNTYSSPQLT